MNLAGTARPGSPQAILDQAQWFMQQPTRLTRGLWPRAAALLIRQALEAVLARFWQRFSYGTEEASVHVQLISLRFYLHHDPELASEIRWVWHRLSRACHAHPYELAPTLAELQGWIAAVTRLKQELLRLVPTSPSSRQSSSEVSAARANGYGTRLEDAPS